MKIGQKIPKRPNDPDENYIIKFSIEENRAIYKSTKFCIFSELNDPIYVFVYFVVVDIPDSLF